MSSADTFEIAGRTIRLGQRADLEIPVTESATGTPVLLPLHVWRAPRPGPTVFITAAVHGDELNGTGIIREIILEPPFDLAAGTLLLVPVINILGFERQMRYMPDRRDLNRQFPGSPEGSLARRFAHVVFREIVLRSDYGIDLHSAAVRRTNFPNVRADLTNKATARIARAFGCELVINGKGPRGSLRRAACAAGRPAIILEAGEVFKIEPTVVECGLAGIRNVLIELDMVRGQPRRPVYQACIRRTEWIRAEAGGLLRFHIAPGDLVEAGQPIATNTNLLGREQNILLSPCDGIVLGMATHPSVKPGDPVCHLAVPDEGIAPIREALARASHRTLHHRLREDLATNVTVADQPAT